MQFTIWYMRPEFFSEGNMGHDWLKEHDMLPDPKKLSKTHIELKKLDDLADTERVLESIWMHMQAEQWSPNGEARDLIKSKGLRHTSMCVGDIIVKGNGQVFMADTFGFICLFVPTDEVAATG